MIDGMTIGAPSRIDAPRAGGVRDGRVRSIASQHPTLLLVAFGVLAALAAWLRIPAVARDTLWAEDGRNFLQDAINVGPGNSLFIAYAGYLHTVPRMIAAAVESMLPVSGWALGMTAGSCVVAGALTVAVFVATRGVITWMPARLVIASLTVLAPLGPREVLGNAANLHSLFMWALFWIAVSRPRTRSSVIGLSVVALLGALTEVQSLFLLPLFLFRWRERRRWPARAMLLIGAMTQLAVTLTLPRAPSPHSANDPLSIAYGYLINAVIPWGIPQAKIGPVLDAVGPLVGILLVIPLGFAALLVIRRGTATERVVVVALAVGSVAVFCISVITNPNTFYDYAGMTPTQLAGVWLTRYGVVPSMMLGALLPIALGVARRIRRQDHAGISRARTTVLLVLCGLLLVSAVTQFVPDDTRRSSGPEWQPQLAAASESCESGPRGSRVVLRETIGWHVSVPCSLLRPDDPDPLR
jgi:hypothetical protein